jgi:hypothetical protein
MKGVMPMSDRPRTTAEQLQEAISRHHRIASYLAEVLDTRHPDDIWPYLEAVLADITAMAAVIRRQGTDLAQARLDRANLAAAALAVITAAKDGEPDALSYLRDELRAQGHDASGHRSRP